MFACGEQEAFVHRRENRQSLIAHEKPTFFLFLVRDCGYHHFRGTSLACVHRSARHAMKFAYTLGAHETPFHEKRGES